MNKKVETLFTVIITFILSMLTPPLIWILILYIPGIGNFDLIGEADTIDPGAVIVTIMYLLLAAVISVLFIRKGKKHIGISIICESILLSVIVFSIISSIIWF